MAQQPAPPEETAPDENDAQNDGQGVPQEVQEAEQWREKALSLQAEMGNFKKRQARRADEAIAKERERMLRLFVPVADNLSRALNQAQTGEDVLREGVELTYRELLRVLEIEGVTRIDTVNQPFDPNLHEAMTTVPAEDVEPGLIVEEYEAGYKIGDKLLRPARVVVAA